MMNTYKVGDRVRLVGEPFSDKLKNTVWVVVAREKNDYLKIVDEKNITAGAPAFDVPYEIAEKLNEGKIQ